MEQTTTRALDVKPTDAELDDAGKAEGE